LKSGLCCGVFAATVFLIWNGVDKCFRSLGELRTAICFCGRKGQAVVEYRILPFKNGCGIYKPAAKAMKQTG